MTSRLEPWVCFRPAGRTGRSLTAAVDLAFCSELAKPQLRSGAHLSGHNSLSLHHDFPRFHARIGRRPSFGPAGEATTSGPGHDSPSCSRIAGFGTGTRALNQLAEPPWLGSRGTWL